jgi:hypothetical protein
MGYDVTCWADAGYAQIQNFALKTGKLEKPAL